MGSVPFAAKPAVDLHGSSAIASLWSPELRAQLEDLAAGAGFDLTGIAPATAVPETAQRFTEWIDQGRAGEMDYLKRRDAEGTLLRTAVHVALPWARSVIVCAFNYNADAPRSIDPAPAATGWIARYAWSGRPQADGSLAPIDYHDDLLARLRRVEAGLLAYGPMQTRCYVDTGPILERDLAAKAGIGWIGKNTCVLNQQLGSWLLLGVIVTSLELPLEAAPLTVPDRCGSCTRCLEACPTDALVAPREMDASLCIAYLTIEKKGSIPEHLRDGMGRQVFGCDICQEVCPWNGAITGRHTPIASRADLQPRPGLVNPPLSWLAAMDAASFKRHFKGSALERTKRSRLHRNTAIAMGNSGDLTFLPQLEHWSAGNDPILAEAAQWAMAKLRPRPGENTTSEQDPPC